MAKKRKLFKRRYKKKAKPIVKRHWFTFRLDLVGRLKQFIRHRYTLAFFKLCIAVVLPFFVLGLFYNAQIEKHFGFANWQLGAEVYGDTPQLVLGEKLDTAHIDSLLQARDYRRIVATPKNEGEYQIQDRRITIFRRAFQAWDGKFPAQLSEISLVGGRIEALRSPNKPLDSLRLEPVYLGQFDSFDKQERIIARGSAIPPFLISALVAVEDKDYFQHPGLSLSGIVRSLIENWRAGEIRQGGSTLTQQFVKNRFLSSEKSLVRKAHEALMALLLEQKYNKEKILEAYINEVYFSQNGGRAIHGFATAAQHFFAKPLKECNKGELALLIGMLKAPSLYNPVKNPRAAKKRRNQVLAILQEEALISAKQESYYRQQKFIVDDAINNKRNTPAFFDSVKRELAQDYGLKALRNRGLKIYTSLDPNFQNKLEAQLKKAVENLQQRNPETLQAAAISLNTQTGEILGLVGAKDRSSSGFNRALDAQRPIGSLIKPLIYVTALNQPKRYDLMTTISDRRFALDTPNGETWEPENIDRKEHGEVTLLEALSQSYNLAAARLGLEVGLGKLLVLLDAFELGKRFELYPAITLGAIELSPMQVAQVYVSLANQGRLTKPKLVTAIVNAQGNLLNRYPAIAKPIIKPETAQLMQFALQKVVTQGTAKSLSWEHKKNAVAGKTGSSDGFRDSWFVGFTGQHLTVVWLGNDDNKSIGLSGASGALKVWDAIMSRAPKSRIDIANDKIEFAWVGQPENGGNKFQCDNAVRIPYVREFPPEKKRLCSSQALGNR